MDIEPLIRAIVSALMLLENSGPEEVDPDVAVKGMENMAHEILKFSGDDRSAFATILDRIANSERDADVADFIRSVPRILGLTS